MLRAFNSDGTLTCTKCGLSKPPAEFRDRKEGRLKKSSLCKPCHYQSSSKAHKAWKARNPDKKAAHDRRYYLANREGILAATADYRKTLDPEQQRVYFREYRRKHAERDRPRSNATAARRRARLRQATPSWADHEKIAVFYAEAAARGLEVDHIVPLASKTVCGLHVHNNLQLLPTSENRRKSNRCWPDMPT